MHIPQTAEKQIGPRRELCLVVAYSFILIGINAYICRDLFYVTSTHTNSMHGFVMAIAARSGGTWFNPTWWPYWDCGIPFEFTYAPLTSRLTAIVAHLRSIPY